jgi:uncharacterized membrane protein
MIDRCLRILRHRWLDEQHSRRVLGPAGLQRIQEAIVESERHHSGEIRVCIEAGLPWSYLRRGADARERAIMMFGKLKVWDTEQNNGVLIYLLLADHRIEIVADRGLNRHVDAGQWQEIVGGLSLACREKRFEAGLLHAIEAIDGLLRRHFPAEAGSVNPNELPDAAHLI